ncbi:IS607 family element RNA-guided endonuclease TnpB [Lentzea albidocapillata]|uniref:Putative transposase n=1 Tax=Lentzea albidocapillata TaxID=40571 RepID=A0A1W2FH25_9PSEU|nr:IS607 family element RNA-guided endonuclease TnpB [Lentzea albidocapillata]SMD21237.1 putative transposase [Lentzea albidocapillata]
MVTVIQAYRFALDPTAGQQAALQSHCGAQRYAYNWGLARIKANLDQRAAEQSYDIPADQLTPPVSWSAYRLRKDWNQAKDEVAPWWGENSKEAYSSGLANLATALTNWRGSLIGTRRGPRVWFPRFKGKRAGVSCRFTTGAFGLTDDRRHVTLPRIGTVRTHESTRKPARHVERGTARIRSATVSYQSGRWFGSFSVEITRADPAATRLGAVVGVDLGLKSLAVLSTGEVVPNPRHLDLAQRELRRLQRQADRRVGPDKRSGQRPSNRWRKTQVRIARLHTRIAHARRDGLHKLTTRLVRGFGTIVLEDLNVSGMLRNRRLSRYIADTGMGELRRQATYKATWAGGRLVVADRWYPSSKTCSDCGAVKTKLPLHVRVYHCDECDLVLDRDLNAARNLVALVGETAGGTSAASCAGTLNKPDGNPCQTHTVWAAGSATGRPSPPPGVGQRRRRKATTA